MHLPTALLTILLTAAHALPGGPHRSSPISARQNLPDPAGEKNVGNGAGAQFIAGQCLADADCASGCCATLPRGAETIGVCSGVGAQNQAGKQGCGFGGAGNAPVGGDGGNGNGNGNGNGGNGRGRNGGNGNGNGNGGSGGNGNGNNGGGGGTGGQVLPSTLVPDPAGADKVGNGNGQQFITGECLADADCASGCCALVNTGDRFFGSCSGVGANTQNGKQGCGFPVGGGSGI